VERFRAGSPRRVGDATLVVVERIRLLVDRGDSWAWASGSLEPIAILVRDARGVSVLGVEERPITLEELRRKVPELDASLSPAA
jgi:uncharacterized spore protein YtfJ